jgi:hypothetical protein
MSRRLLVALALVPLSIACTGVQSDETLPTSGAPSSSFALPAIVHAEDITYDVACTPVAEALVDIDLAHGAGEPKIRAITGLWDKQAVAVLANDPKGCGVWALGIAEGLSDEAAEQIRDEVARGVKDFGVTASPVPRDEGSG